MKLKASFIPLLFISILASAQYEQKISLTVSAGTFKTFGWKGDVDPTQMPNYGVGFSGNVGVQFKINDRFSLSAEFGIMLTQSWSFEDLDGNNYHDWEIRDTITNEITEVS